MNKGFQALVAALLITALAIIADAEGPAADGPQYSKDGRLMRPQNFREWVFLSSGLGMTYGPLAAAEPRFDNVFVNPSAYRAFVETGRWPDKTVLVLEVRSGEPENSIGSTGHFQGKVAGIEMHVKDEKRFPRKWAFFGFREGAEASEPAAAETSSCYACHEPSGAVDTTFVQFYPTLLPVAKEKGTLKLQ